MCHSMKNANLSKELMKDDPFTDILGQAKVKHNLKSALLMERNVLIVGAPGIGKTTMAKNVSKLLDENNFVRIQGSPDLTVEDLFGDIDPVKALKFGPQSMEAFSKGKIFKANEGILFFDELNRCPEKLQNALLQVLEERKITLGTYTIDFDVDFIFIATMNPEDSSTERLSDVLLDRFDVIYMGYPEDVEVESKIVDTKSRKIDISFPDDVLTKLATFVRLIRESEKIEKVPSVRASIGLYERAQSNAMIAGRNAVEFSDVEQAIISVLSHRIKLKPSVEYLKSPEEFIKEELHKFAGDQGIDLTSPNGGSP